MGGVEFLQDLVYDGVGDVGNHRQFDFSVEDCVGGKRETERKRFGGCGS